MLRIISFYIPGALSFFNYMLVFLGTTVLGGKGESLLFIFCGFIPPCFFILAGILSSLHDENSKLRQRIEQLEQDNMRQLPPQ